jgi:glucokinase
MPWTATVRSASAGRAANAWVVGADVGATKIVAGLVDPRGRIRSRDRREVPPSRAPGAVTDRIAECIAACRASARSTPVVIGVGIAGQIDSVRGVVRYAPNLRWKNFALGPRLREASRLPVYLANDVRAIAVGEWHFGAGRGLRDLLCISVGTGVGGGVVVDGHLLEGATNSTGEIGHTMLVAGGRKCTCPHRGCLEAYVGGWAIEERARARARRSPASAKRLIREAGAVTRITPRALERAARAGDPFSRALVEEFASEFAAGVVGLVNAFNPRRVIVGGTVAEGFPEYLHRARVAVREGCQPAAALAQVVPSRLGPDAGILGAAWLARSSLAPRTALSQRG